MKTFIFLFLVRVLSAASEAAQVVTLSGLVKAVRTFSEDRILEAGSPIYVKDTIVVGDNSSVQIKYLDESILDLKEKTKYAVKEFVYNKPFAKDTSQSELIEGGFRLLSGSIKPDPSRYKIKTPNSTIGLMGTLLEADYAEETLRVACTQGRILIQTAVGSVVIGEGMEQYAIVTSSMRRPQIFISPPAPTIRPNIRPNVSPLNR